MRTYSQSGCKHPRPYEHYPLSLLTFTYIPHEYSAFYLTTLRKVPWNALSCLCRVWQSLGLFAGMESTAFDLNGIVPTNRRNRYDAELSENRHEVSKQLP